MTALRFDIVILGGGVSGLGVAQAAADRGFKTALIEKAICSAATSASSLRIIHGGLRYLQKLDLPRVVASIRAQSDLLARYPQHIRPLPCLMPLKPFGFLSRRPMTAAAVLYNSMTRAVSGRANGATVIEAGDIAPAAPSLQRCQHGILSWNDALLLDPADFAVDLKQALQTQGVQIVEGVAAQRVQPRAGGALEVILADAQVMAATVVVNTLGPWLATIDVPAELVSPRKRPNGWCKAFNLILRRCLEPNYAIGIFGEQKRSYFIVPRDGSTVIGTWYIPFSGDPDAVSISKAEINEFVTSFNKAAFTEKIAADDVAGVEVGVLPMERVNERGPVLYGRERLSARGGYIEVLSTKYTTFRTQAARVLQVAQGFLRAR